MRDLEEQRKHHLRNELYEGASAQVVKFFQDNVDLPLDEKQMRWLANQLCNYLSEYWAGQTITFAKDYYYKIDERDFEIYNKVTANNFRQVAREYNLTPNGLYRVINRIKHRAIKRAGQQDIFDN